MDRFRKLLRKYKFIVNVLVLFVGAFLLILAYFFRPMFSKDTVMKYDILIGIGCSVIATALITLFLLALIPDDKDDQDIKELGKWGIRKIYRDRKLRKFTSDIPKKQMDLCLIELERFGLIKDELKTQIRDRIKTGLKIRIITLHPRSPYLLDRQRLDKIDFGDEIEKLEKWKKDVLASAGSGYSNSIEIRYYNNLPQSFYCRLDKRIFVGLHIPRTVNEDSITYEFKGESSEGYKYYKGFFEKLWSGGPLKFLDPSTSSLLVGSQKSSVESALEHFCTELMETADKKKAIGIVVMFKGEKRRTIFSCNKRNERNRCYEKDIGTVGHLILKNKKLEERFGIIFEDLRNELSFVSYYTDTTDIQQKEKFERVTGVGNDEVVAILAIPVIDKNNLIGAITFDFQQLPQKYDSQIEEMKKIEEGGLLSDESDLVLQRWFRLSENCKKIIEPMLGSGMELKYKDLFEEDWT